MSILSLSLVVMVAWEFEFMKRKGVKKVVKVERRGKRMVRTVRAGNMGRERVLMVMCS